MTQSRHPGPRRSLRLSRAGSRCSSSPQPRLPPWRDFYSRVCCSGHLGGGAQRSQLPSVSVRARAGRVTLVPASQPGSGHVGLSTSPQVRSDSLAAQRDGASGDRNMKRASVDGIPGGLFRCRGFCTTRLSSSGATPTVQFRNLDPGVGAQRGGEDPQSRLEAGPFSRACSPRWEAGQ